MKFTGLILICASSCLALILPAFGVVQFPKVSKNANVPAGMAVSTNSGFSPSPGFPEAMPGGASQTSDSMRTLTDVVSSNLLGPSNFPLTNAFQTESPFPPSLGATSASKDGLSSNRNLSKFGLGVWLLLGPVCLIGLGLWCFSPNPSGTKPKQIN